MSIWFWTAVLGAAVGVWAWCRLFASYARLPRCCAETARRVDDVEALVGWLARHVPSERDGGAHLAVMATCALPLLPAFVYVAGLLPWQPQSAGALAARAVAYGAFALVLTYATFVASLVVIDRRRSRLRNWMLASNDRRLVAAGVAHFVIPACADRRGPERVGQETVLAAVHAQPAAFIPLLTGPDRRAAAVAGWALARSTHPATSALLARELDHGDPLTRGLIFDALRLRADDAVAAVAGLVRSGDLVARALAVELLGQLGGAAAEAALIEALGDPAAPVRRAARAARRGRRVPPAPTASPADAWLSQDAKAIAGWGDAVAPICRAALASPDVEERRGAIRMLEHLPGAWAVELLLDAPDDHEARAALAARLPADGAAIRRALTGDQPFRRIRAAAVLADAGEPAGIDALRATLSSERVDERWRAAGALAASGSPDARAALARWLDDADPIVRGYAHAAAGWNR